MNDIERNKDVCRRFYQAITAADEPALAELCAPDVRFTVLGQQLDFAGHLQLVRGFHAAFTDPVVVSEEVVAEGDRVFTRGYFTGRHTGTFQGIPATGRTVKVPTIGFHRLRQGRVVEHSSEMSGAALMAQLGVQPG